MNDIDRKRAERALEELERRTDLTAPQRLAAIGLLSSFHAIRSLCRELGKSLDDLGVDDLVEEAARLTTDPEASSAAFRELADRCVGAAESVEDRTMPEDFGDFGLDFTVYSFEHGDECCYWQSECRHCDCGAYRAALDEALSRRPVL